MRRSEGGQGIARHAGAMKWWRERAAGEVAYWHYSEVPAAATEGSSSLQSGPRQAVRRRVYEFTP